MKNISILGSTGSIGSQTLDVIRNNMEEYKLCGMTGHSNIDLLEKQIKEFRPRLVALGNPEYYGELRARVGDITEICIGTEGLVHVATMEEVDTVVSAIVGIAGLTPTYSAIINGKDIALANKETLVTAGNIIMDAAQKNGVSILPVDSEHSAIFQSIGCNEKESVAKIILTASGGPFRNKNKEELKSVTIADTLKHPNWTMGKKITVDSATLMNKGLEVIEAKWLFDLELENIEVCIHPQSIIHSAVEFTDGAVIAQMGTPDMRLPIQYALTYPTRKPMNGKRLDLFEIGTLTFERPDTERFPCLRLAFEALKAGDSACVVLNGSNEIAVKLFLEGRISFVDINIIIDRTLEQHAAKSNLSLEEVLELDQWARVKTMELYYKYFT